MIITNIVQVPGKTIIQELGLVQGSTVRGKHIGAFFKGLVGVLGWLVATWFERRHFKSMDDSVIVGRDA